MSLRDKIIAKMNADWSAYQRTVRILTLHDRECALLADAALAALRPHEAVADAKPVVCYFATDADRDEFIEAVQDVKPNMKAVKV